MSQRHVVFTADLADMNHIGHRYVQETSWSFENLLQWHAILMNINFGRSHNKLIIHACCDISLSISRYSLLLSVKATSSIGQVWGRYRKSCLKVVIPTLSNTRYPPQHLPYPSFPSPVSVLSPRALSLLLRCAVWIVPAAQRLLETYPP